MFHQDKSNEFSEDKEIIGTTFLEIDATMQTIIPQALSTDAMVHLSFSESSPRLLAESLIVLSEIIGFYRDYVTKELA